MSELYIYSDGKPRSMKDIPLLLQKVEKWCVKLEFSVFDKNFPTHYPVGGVNVCCSNIATHFQKILDKKSCFRKKKCRPAVASGDGFVVLNFQNPTPVKKKKQIVDMFFS